jgi:hypothetical protein
VLLLFSILAVWEEI